VAVVACHGQKASRGWLRWPGPAATQPRSAWLRRRGANAPAVVTACGAVTVARSPAAGGKERCGGMAPAARGGGVGQGIGDGGSPRRCDESRMVLF
jgi:hypothetical protein